MHCKRALPLCSRAVEHNLALRVFMLTRHSYAISCSLLEMYSKERLRRVMKEALGREEGLEHSRELLYRFKKATVRSDPRCVWGTVMSDRLGTSCCYRQIVRPSVPCSRVFICDCFLEYAICAFRSLHLYRFLLLSFLVHVCLFVPVLDLCSPRALVRRLQGIEDKAEEGAEILEHFEFVPEDESKMDRHRLVK